MEGLPLEIGPLDVSRRLRGGEALRLIDVREPHEFAICRIESAQPVPMRSIPQALEFLKAQAQEATLILYCHHGVRSKQAASWLRQKGVACQSMSGGIDCWAASVDPGLRRY
jgi:rhodanese-related sulfurtransferase